MMAAGQGPGDSQPLNAPTVTILVPVFNAVGTLQQCIDSVLSQTHPFKEVVVIDGGSSDGTVEMLRRNSTRLGYWESRPDRGAYHAINKGIANAKGTWIGIIGADDFLWQPDVLEKLLTHHRDAGGTAGMIHGQVAQLDDEGKILRLIGGPDDVHTDPSFGTVPVPPAALLIHRRLFEAYGTFDETYRIAADFEFLLRVLPREKALFVPGVISLGMRGFGGMSSTVKNIIIQGREVRRALRHHGVTDHPDPFLSYPMGLVNFGAYKLLGERGHHWLTHLYRRVKRRMLNADNP